jgi:hypothetical protein
VPLRQIVIADQATVNAAGDADFSLNVPAVAAGRTTSWLVARGGSLRLPRDPGGDRGVPLIGDARTRVLKVSMGLRIHTENRWHTKNPVNTKETDEKRPSS